jgi:hypothetical protein
MNSSGPEIAPQMSVSTSSSVMRLARVHGWLASMYASARLTSCPASTSISSTCLATSNTGEMRPDQVGIAILIAGLFTNAVPTRRSLQDYP